MEPLRAHVIIHGLVQGVFFRAGTREEAVSIGVSGWVRNLPDGRVRWVPPGRLDAVETVFAMTVHKSQGSEFGHVLLVLPDRPQPLLTRELIYTAVTRARSAFTLLEYGPPSVLAQAIKRRTWRASGLAERLAGATPSSLP